eukprot:TRINITY_DN45756_c0_g1_i1.p1 TRINITY_DN45756_c0_g1~~TRINITY_DN45756_c0_g1_i1.p1  ORF type:complete len:408 (+),score=42.34 TRINITY_DN45756_c0_g1_i1:182-1405(+)
MKFSSLGLLLASSYLCSVSAQSSQGFVVSLATDPDGFQHCFDPQTVGRITVGTPPQHVTVQFDAGSPYPWLEMSSARPDLSAGTYDPSSSSSAIADNKSFSLPYVQWGTVNGSGFHDVMQFLPDGNTIPPVRAYVAAISSASGAATATPWVGKIGFAPPSHSDAPPQILQAMLDAGLIDQPIISARHGGSRPAIAFGKTLPQLRSWYRALADPTTVRRPLTASPAAFTTPMVGRQYMMANGTVAFAPLLSARGALGSRAERSLAGSFTLPGMHNVFVDTGTPGVLVPQAVWPRLKAFWGCVSEITLPYFPQPFCAVPMSVCRTHESLGPAEGTLGMTLAFGSNVTLPLSSAPMWKRVGTGADAVCVSVVQPTARLGDMVLIGRAWLVEYDVEYNIAAQTLTLAPPAL